MADIYIPAADIIKINDKNVKTDLKITDILDGSPLLEALYATESSNGVFDSYLKSVTLPSVGFRDINYGIDHAPGTFVQVDNKLKYLDATHTPIDIAGVKASNKEDLIARAIEQGLKSGVVKAEWQLINGVSDSSDTNAGHTSGFNGLKALVDPTMVIKAGGTTANTGSSIYLVRSVPDATGVCSVWNSEENIKVGETYQARVLGLNGLPLDAYITPMGVFIGMRIGATRSAVRIANITEDAGKTATDNLIYKGCQKAAAGRPYTHAVMGSRSYEQIRLSRTATSPTGAPADYPDSIAGLKIIVTDAIGETEALVA